MKIKIILKSFKKLISKLFSIIGFLRYSLYHHFEKSLLRTHESIITLSKRSKQNLIRIYEINGKRIKTIPCGVYLNRFNPQNYSQKIREKYGNKMLLFSGLMIKRKNVPVLLKAMRYVIKELPDVQLILTGKGPLLQSHKNLSKSLNIQNNTTFLGFVSDKELAQYYATSDIFVFPSELEGFGQVILESLASGTPVICSDVPPMAEIIENAGLTFKLNDPKDLSDKIIQLFKDKNLYNELKKNTLRVAKKYTWKNIAMEYQRFIKNVIK